MFFFKTETRYEYSKQVGNKVFIDPLFYSAYQYARKALIDMFPDDESLNNIETSKEYHSLDLKLKPRHILKEVRLNTYLEDNQKIEAVEVSDFFFKLMDTLPFYFSYRMYRNADVYMPEVEVSLRGPRRYFQNFGRNNTLTQDFNMMKNRLYKRGVNEKVDTLNINQLFIYLGLGESYFPTVTSFEINSVDDYLEKLNNTIIEITDVMDEFTPSKEALLTLLPNAGNEARASFFNAMEPSLENLEEYLFISVSDLNSVRQPYFYPTSIEKKEVKSDHFIGTPGPLSHLVTESEPMINKIKNDGSESGFINVETNLDGALLKNGYNMRLICENGEGRYLYFRKTMNHENLISHQRSGLRELMITYDIEVSN